MVVRYMCGSSLAEATQVCCELAAQYTESTIGDPIKASLLFSGKEIHPHCSGKEVVSGCFCHKSLWHHVYR